MEDEFDNIRKIVAKEHLMTEIVTQTYARKSKKPESALDKLMKGMKDLQLKFAKLQKGESLGVKEKLKEGEKNEFIR